MLTLITGIPGSRKTAYCVDKINKVENDNVINLLRNIEYYQQNKVSFESHKTEFLYNIEKEGTGDLITEKRVELSVDYFDIFEKSIDDREDLPIDYYERLVTYNNICKRISDEYNIENYFELLPVRFIYSNIAELTVDNVKSLEHLRDENGCIDWRKAPLGSYIVIDEIQLIEPYRQVKLRDNEIIKELSIHRHLGYDIDIITQSTSYINVELKDLFEVHLHVTKPFGLASKIFHYEQFQQNPNAVSVRARAAKTEKFDPDSNVFELYKSTKIDTSQVRTPWKMIILWGSAFLLCLSLVFFMVYRMYRYFVPVEKKEEVQVSEQVDTVEQKKNELLSNLNSITDENQKKDIEIRENKLSSEHIKSIDENQKLLNQLQIDREIENLRQQRLTTKYYAERKDPTIVVRSVVAIGGKCTAYNLDSVKLNLSQAECNKYLKEGLPHFAKYANNKISSSRDIGRKFKRDKDKPKI